MDNTYLSIGTRIDNNGKPGWIGPEGGAEGEGAAGPTVRPLDDGVGSAYIGSGDPDRAPISTTLPAEQGGVQADGKPKSLLQELDEE